MACQFHGSREWLVAAGRGLDFSDLRPRQLGDIGRDPLSIIPVRKTLPKRICERFLRNFIGRGSLPKNVTHLRRLSLRAPISTCVVVSVHTDRKNIRKVVTRLILEPNVHVVGICIVTFVKLKFTTTLVLVPVDGLDWMTWNTKLVKLLAPQPLPLARLPTGTLTVQVLGDPVQLGVPSGPVT